MYIYGSIETHTIIYMVLYGYGTIRTRKRVTRQAISDAEGGAAARTLDAFTLVKPPGWRLRRRGAESGSVATAPQTRLTRLVGRMAAAWQQHLAVFLGTA